MSTMMGMMPGITVGFVLSEKEKNKSVQVVFVFMFEKLKKAKRLDLFTDWLAERKRFQHHDLIIRLVVIEKQ